MICGECKKNIDRDPFNNNQLCETCDSIKLKKDLDLLDTADNQEHIKMTYPKNTTEVKA